jgi:hypothetical protein
MGRLTDNDKRFGPITYGRVDWRPLRFVFSTGGGVDEHRHNNITCYGFGWVARISLPTRFSPYKRWVSTGHYEWADSPDSGYWDVHPREYGFSLHDGFFQLFLGPQTMDSTTTKSWAKHLPWTQWRHVRFSLYDETGKHYWTQHDKDRKLGFWDDQMKAQESCPKVKFLFTDFDGKEIVATTHIEEREWHFGEGWFKWLSLFRKPMIRRSLSLEFSAEVGPEKGSWKGGTIGHSIEMLPGELHEPAFRRYCEQEHRSKYRRFKISFVGAPVAA